MRFAGAFLLLGLALPACKGTHDGVSTDQSDAAPYPDPPDGEAVTWNDWVAGFSNEYCVSCHSPDAQCGGSGCHEPSDPTLYNLLFDMRQQTSWVDRAATIRCGIAVTQDPAWQCSEPPETYPKHGNGNPMPTDDARAVVVDWINASCP